MKYVPFLLPYADYDPAGRLPGYTNFNNTTTAFSYDNAGRLTTIANRKQDSSIISSYSYTLDGNGNRGQTVQSEPYAPATSGSNVTYSYNTQKNRLLTAGSTSFTYDDEGQLATGGGSTYTFDYEHRLKTVGSTTQFYYDGSGNRIRAIRNGVQTRYIYDAAGRLLAEADANNNITKYYIYGNGLLAAVTPAGQVYCYHYNGVGSTIAMTDQTQTVVNKYSHDVFGNVENQQETVLQNQQPFKYVGQAGVMTEPNGFYYMRARYYDPQVGRFISEDPIGFEGGDVNLMVYVGNNPVTGIDPEGLCAENNQADHVGFAVALSGFINNFLRLPKTSSEAALWSVDVINNKVGILSSGLPESHAKSYADLAIATVGVTTAVLGESYGLSLMSGVVLGRAINNIPMGNSTVQNKLSDVIWENRSILTPKYRTLFNSGR